MVCYGHKFSNKLNFPPQFASSPTCFASPRSCLVAQTCNSETFFLLLSFGEWQQVHKHKQNSHKTKMYSIYTILMDFYWRKRKKCNNCRANVVFLLFGRKVFLFNFEKFCLQSFPAVLLEKQLKLGMTSKLDRSRWPGFLLLRYSYTYVAT